MAFLSDPGPVPHEPLAEIRVLLHKRPTGQAGQYTLEPEVQMSHMPGGWRTVHYGLTMALHAVLPQVEAQAKQEGVVKLATHLPGGNALLR